MTPAIRRMVVLGPAHPYRGGLASIMELLARTFQRRGTEARIVTFRLQYPRLLFPGKTQLTDRPAPDDLRIERAVNTLSPVSWWRVGRRLFRERPDVVLLKYWTPFMAPAFGTIARLARRNRHTRVVVQLDNIAPHEHHWVDRPLNRYFLRSCDGFIYMSHQVGCELDAYDTGRPALFSPHPLFVNFGEKLPRAEACAALGLDPALRYALFFGIVRDYKGLDLLLDAWALMRSKGETAGRRLLVAGEFYYNKERYLEQIARLGLKDEVILHDYFIPDDRVATFFSAVDLLVQPYWSATQSGVTQIAYNYDVPMVVTDVGGLAEIVPDGVVGYVARTAPQSVAEAVGKAWEPEELERLRAGVAREKERFSWEKTADRIEELYRLTLSESES